MDANLLNEINYLTRLIEEHKQQLPAKLNSTQKTFINPSFNITRLKEPTKLVHQTSSTKMPEHQKCNLTNEKKENVTKVLVNPNFKLQNSVIHINPKIHMKTKIHVNPQVMKNVCVSKENVNNNLTQVPEHNEPSLPEAHPKHSVYVNPKLMTKLSTKTQDKPVEIKQRVVQGNITPVGSRLKLVRKTSKISPSPAKKLQNSNVVILSKRKLVRVKRSTKVSPISSVGSLKLKKPLNSPFKKVKPSPRRVIKCSNIVSSLKQCATGNNNLIKFQNTKSSTNKYRIDRTNKVTESKKNTSDRKTSMNKKLEFITIGGIAYTSSKNQLIRRSYGSKKRKAANSRNDKFIIATNGKKLCRIKNSMENKTPNVVTSNSAVTMRLSLSAIHKSNLKTNISNKVKQRSIQILRNKMHKNNQPCLIFQKFGYCANHEKGTCLKRHDKKQVTLCKKFLQGNCLLDNCRLSHDVCPEKMPTCKYFLEGCCVRDACPYRHVKVSSNTPICIEFMQGYCTKGDECKRRHEYLCPKFEKTGKCSKGKYCPYPHKSQLTSEKQDDKHLKRKRKVAEPTKTEVSVDETCSNAEARPRYYEQTETFLGDIEKKRENVMKKMKLMKRVNAILNGENEIVDNSSDKEITDESVEELDQLESKSDARTDVKLPKRPPIGTLPAYIPID